MRAPDEIFRREHVGLARTRTPAPHIDSRRPVRTAREDGHSGDDAIVGRMSYQETRHIRDEISDTGSKHRCDYTGCAAMTANPCKTRSGTISPRERIVPVIMPASPPVMNNLGLMPVLCSITSAARSASPANAKTAPRDTAPMVLLANTPASEGVLCATASAISLVLLIKASR